MKTLAEVIQYYMTERGYTLAEVGRRSGLSGDAIAKYLAGSEPSLTAFRKLCGGLGVTPAEFLAKLPGLAPVKYMPARPRGRPPVAKKGKRKEAVR